MIEKICGHCGEQNFTANSKGDTSCWNCGEELRRGKEKERGPAIKFKFRGDIATGTFVLVKGGEV